MDRPQSSDEATQHGFSPNLIRKLQDWRDRTYTDAWQSSQTRRRPRHRIRCVPLLLKRIPLRELQVYVQPSRCFSAKTKKQQTSNERGRVLGSGRGQPRETRNTLLSTVSCNQQIHLLQTAPTQRSQHYST